MKTILISPTNEASQRTKNRIRENGPVFVVDWEKDTQSKSEWLLHSQKTIWMGWLPRNEFHVECIGKKFIEKVLAN